MSKDLKVVETTITTKVSCDSTSLPFTNKNQSKKQKQNSPPLVKRVYGKFCIETLHERHNGIQRLVVCLSEYLQERSRLLVSNITIFCH